MLINRFYNILFYNIKKVDHDQYSLVIHIIWDKHSTIVIFKHIEISQFYHIFSLETIAVKLSFLNVHEKMMYHKVV